MNKKLRTWLVVGIVIAILAAGGAYLMTQGKITLPSTKAATATPTSYTQNVKVERGNITASVSPTGSVYAVNSANLSLRVTATIIELNVKAGQVVKKGDVLARADAESFQRAVDEAEANLLTQQDELESLQAGATELELTKAKLTVAQAEASLAAAKKAKEDLQSPDLDSLKQAVRTAQYDLESARLNLELTRANSAVGKTVRDLEYTQAWYERAIRQLQAAKPGTSAGISAPASTLATESSLAGPGGRGASAQPLTLEGAQAGLSEVQAELALAKTNASVALTNADNRVQSAQEKLANAQEELADAQDGPSALELKQADNTITQAQAKLAKTQADLADLQAGPNEKKLALAEAKVNSAKAVLAQAQANLANATLVAPFDGTIISVNVEEGDDVTSSKAIMSIADLAQLQIMATIDETEISQIAIGQDATITFDAVAGVTFKGKVLEVPVQGTLANNVVTYRVPISLEKADTTKLKPGMTANITIVTGSKQNVLRVPSYAVQQTTEGYIVYVVDAGSSQGAQTAVQTGLTDGVWVEIVRGLNEGDTVAAQYTESTTQQFFRGQGGGSGITMFNMGRVR